jgi:hypothetical protein
MLTQSEQPRSPELDVIARDASLYVWLLTVTKPRKQAAPCPSVSGPTSAFRLFRR